MGRMSWQPDQSGSYSNYGNYNDGQWSGGGDSASYDIFESETNPQQNYSESGFGSGRSSAFYDPTAYNNNPSQQEGTHHRGPTPPNAYGQPASETSVPDMFSSVPQNIMGNPMAGMAMNQAYQAINQAELKKNLDKYVSIGQLKYYFAVDTSYVAKKIGVLLFPFTRSDWAIKYNQDEPVQPKYDLNAPDLYIPTMAYATYVLLVGYILGLRNAFSPDLLGITAVSTLVWLILEFGIIYLTLTIMSINTSLTKWDILSFSSYKYVGIIAVLISGLLLQSYGYYISLIYVSLALIWFLTRTLKLRIEPEVHGMQVHGKRKLYIILMYAALQPLLIWWMTYSLVPISTSVNMNDIPGSAQMVP